MKPVELITSTLQDSNPLKKVKNSLYGTGVTFIINEDDVFNKGNIFQWAEELRNKNKECIKEVVLLDYNTDLVSIRNSLILIDLLSNPIATFKNYGLDIIANISTRRQKGNSFIIITDKYDAKLFGLSEFIFFSGDMLPFKRKEYIEHERGFIL